MPGFYETTSSFATSVVTQMELIIGCRNKTEIRKLEQLLERFEIIPINERISNIATVLLKEYH